MAVVLVAPAPAYAAPVGDELTTAVGARLAETDTPGAALFVTDAEAGLHTRTWGVDGAGEPVTLDTPFLWGSVAKPVTATVVVELAADDLVNLDSPVTEYLPDFAPTWQGRPATVTVAQLLDHTSGLPTSLIGEVTDVYDNEPGAVSRVASRMNDVSLDTAPGAHYAYNSVDYLMLGAVVESVTDRPFADVLHGIVLDPVGMTHAVTGPQTFVPPGHRQVFGNAVRHYVPYDLSGLPYGYLGGSATDLARFARAMLSPQTGPIPAETIKTLHTPRPATGDGYGLGWSLGTLPGTQEPMIWHSGATPGFQAVLILLPRQGIAVVLLQNTFSLLREEQLLNAAFDAARISAGHTTRVDGFGAPLLAAPWAIGGIALLLATAAALSLRTRPRTRRSRLLWIGSGAVVAAAGLGAPALMGASWNVLWLWTPDVAWTLAAAVTTATTLAAMHIAALMRSRSARTPNRR